jgi:hypothetical protein
VWNKTYTFIGICTFIISTYGSVAQENNDQQIWLEFTLNHTIQSGILYTSEINYSRILENNEIWSRYHLNQVFTYNIIAPVDLSGGIFTSVETPVKNTNPYDIIEIRPWIGIRIHFNPAKRFLIRAYVRFEERFIFYLSEFFLQTRSGEGGGFIQVNYKILSIFHL